MGSTRFTDKVAFVTGAGSGIGRAAALRLAREGANVVGVDVDAAGLAATTEAASDAQGNFVGHTVDVSDRAACFAAIERCVADHGRLDVVGNVAGILHAGHFTDTSEEMYRRVMAVNIDGYFFIAQAAMPHLIESRGSLVNVASNSAIQGVAYLVAYSTSKSAVIGLTRSLAVEYVKTGVRINCIAPAGTMTGLLGSYRLPGDADADLTVRAAGFRGINEADEVAAVFAFIASDESPGIHGAIIPVDRGVTVG
jgi:meso-butanediol dehydrogenase / (S,S)-butanediol dehydrogenase / diacetyl reductase